MLAPDVVSEVEAALGAGDPPLGLSPVPPELQREAI